MRCERGENTCYQDSSYSLAHDPASTIHRLKKVVSMLTSPPPTKAQLKISSFDYGLSSLIVLQSWMKNDPQQKATIRISLGIQILHCPGYNYLIFTELSLSNYYARNDIRLAMLMVSLDSNKLLEWL